MTCERCCCSYGAGGDLNDDLLRSVAAGLVDSKVATLRFNFPYREQGRRAPGSQAQSEDCYRAVASSVREAHVPLFCGGKSYGGRMATHIAADGFDVAGLVLFSYPLHPPGKPENIRDAHLHDIDAPILVVQGTRDPFATPELLTRTIDSLPNATLVAIDGGDHSLRVRGRGREAVMEEITNAVADFLDQRARRRDPSR